MGRFMTPDEPFADQWEHNPQSWNLYSYSRNNPIINLDPTGNECVTIKDSNGKSVVGDDGKGKACDHMTQGSKKPDAEVSSNDGTQEGRIFELARLVTEQNRRHNYLEILSKAGPFAFGGYGAARAALAQPTIKITTMNLNKGAIELTKHALKRSIQRGITQAEIDTAVESAKQSGNVMRQIGKFGTEQIHYKGSNGVTVVIETTGRNAGKAISVWR